MPTDKQTDKERKKQANVKEETSIQALRTTFTVSYTKRNSLHWMSLMGYSHKLALYGFDSGLPLEAGQ